VDCYSCGFDERALLEAHVLRELVAVVFRQSVVFSEGAVVGRCGSESHVGTKVVLALLAAYAAAAGNTRLHCDAVSDFQRLDLVTDLLNDTSGLVTKDHGLLNYEVANATLDPVVNI
jgi:hypothetical protein